MERTLEWTVSDSDAGLKIEEFLRSRGYSHHVLTQLKRTERGICLNGEWAYASQRTKAGDKICIHVIEQEASEHILPVPLPLSIVYEDEDLMVINKASDMPIHPSINNYDNTLANAVMYYFSRQNLSFVYRCINRLDRDTSGLLIIAKNMVSGAILSQMSARHQIHREYLTIVEGRLPESGTISAPIARLEGSAIMRCVDFERGEHAVTHYQTLTYCPALMPDSGDTEDIQKPDASDGLSLARVKLETGRTHQIRVHMKYIGHPMVGDFLYNPDSCSNHIRGSSSDRTASVRQTGPVMARQALHSHKLSFHHPITGKYLSFSCDMPEDMQKLLQSS